jgi:hypothetical protein
MVRGQHVEVGARNVCDFAAGQRDDAVIREIVAELHPDDLEKLIALCDDERTVPAKHDILTEGSAPTTSTSSLKAGRRGTRRSPTDRGRSSPFSNDPRLTWVKRLG